MAPSNGVTTTSATKAEAISVSLEDLRAGTVPFSTLEAAFGPSSLGILLVSDLPSQFAELRAKLLSYASYLANLPAEELAKLECPEAKWLVGWSHGRETLKSGVYDTHKGSYYVNCAFYKDASLSSAPAYTSPSTAPPSSTPSSLGDFPEYTAPNIWPADSLLPGFRTTFQALVTLIIDTAVLVARACDRYAREKVDGYPQARGPDGAGFLEGVVKGSLTTKARLLHYFPPASSGEGKEKGDKKDANDDDDDWCATHLDHGCLTGLTSAFFIDETAHPPSLPLPSHGTTLPTLPELPTSPSPSSGLYIHSRSSAVVKVSIPRDSLGFQTGEALERITRGKFRAVPHFVKGPRDSGDRDSGARKIARNTIAVFTQPNLADLVDVDRGLDFAGFAREVVARNH
ncbi:MAG: hypothetical protein M1819_000708 [Sarea resinae]|nr:MAG: hypothetical protein M1819_000708 [Sarea resinae]